MTNTEPKKPKLPKVWVVMQAKEAGECYTSKESALNAIWWAGKGETHLYAPVQKPKVCVWADKGDSVTDYTGCGNEVEMGGGFEFCPYCGGKIRRSL